MTERKASNLPLLNTNGFTFDNNDISNPLRTNGRSKNPEDINVLEMFIQKYGKQPKLFRISNNENYYDWDKLKTLLSEKYTSKEILFSDTYGDTRTGDVYTKQETWSIRDGIILQMEGSKASDFYLCNHDLEGVKNLCAYNLFLIDGQFDEYKDIVDIFKECTIKEKDLVSIGMVSIDDGGFYVKEFDIDKNSNNLGLLDEHYGDGFSDFNDELIERLLTNSKGLTLFHGSPGTGKTTYIRHLLRELKAADKKNNILYYPPTMVDSIVDPNFINFISDWVAESDSKNYLLIEDAEPLLESRDQSRNIGITNLLNITDGLLNDILNIQIIATFNTHIDNIDDALLRPERLIARKDFKNLSIDDAKKLANKIGVSEDLITKEISLAELYSLKNETKPIIHNVEEKRKTIGFNK